MSQAKKAYILTPLNIPTHLHPSVEKEKPIYNTMWEKKSCIYTYLLFYHFIKTIYTHPVWDVSTKHNA